MFGHAFQHDFVIAIGVLTQAWIGSIGIRDLPYTSAHSLAAGIVVAPFDVEPCLAQRVEQIGVARRLIDVELVAPEVREHARH